MLRSKILAVLVLLLTGLLLLTSYPIAKQVLRDRQERETETTVKAQGYADCTQNAQDDRLMEWNLKCRAVYDANKTALTQLFEQKSSLYDVICTMQVILGDGGKTATGSTLNPEECRAWYEERSDGVNVGVEHCKLPEEFAATMNERRDQAIKKCELIWN